jgi:hypothetical protein
MYNLKANRDLERQENSDYSGVSDKCLLRKYLRNRGDFLYAAHLYAPITPAVGRLDCRALPQAWNFRSLSDEQMKLSPRRCQSPSAHSRDILR